MATKFQQHQGFDVGARQWRRSEERPTVRSYDRTEAVDLADLAVNRSFELEPTPVAAPEAAISPEIQEMIADDAAIRQMRRDYLDNEAA